MRSRRERMTTLAPARWLIVSVVAMASGVLVAPAQASAQVPTTSISRAEAKRIVREYNEINAANNDSLSVEGQAGIEAAPILLIDDTTFREYQGRGETTLDEDARVDQVRVFVPEQTGYPRQFLATERVTSGGSKYRQVLVFVQAAEGDDWKVTMAAQLDASDRLPRPLVDRDGASRLVDADHAGDLVARPEALSAELAQVWTRANGEERAPSRVFADGPLTTGVIDVFINRLSNTGVTAEVDFQFAPADEYPAVAYRTEDGGAVVLFAVDARELLRPIDGEGALVQPESRGPLSGLVLPGSYASVVYDRIALVVASVPPEGAKARATALGIYDGTVSVAVSPA
jgi:hypothetical protein